MRLLFISFCCLVCSIVVADEIPSSIKRPHRQISKVVDTLNKELDLHIKIQNLLVEYGSFQEYCIQCPTDQESVMHLVKSARSLLKLIDSLQLQHIFDESFYVELRIIAGEPISKAKL